MKYDSQTQQLIDKAIANKHYEFVFIKTYTEFIEARILYHALLKIYKGFKKIEKETYRDYLINLTKNIDQVNLLIAHHQLQACAKFYKEDALIIKDMIQEYLCYIHDNRLIKSFMGYERPEEDMTDWRKVPFKLF